MDTVIYDDLEWEVEDFPVQSSTPDEFFELTYRCSSKCPNCGNVIEGKANYWSNDESMISTWLESIEYEECECDIEDEDIGSFYE